MRTKIKMSKEVRMMRGLESVLDSVFFALECTTFTIKQIATIIIKKDYKLIVCIVLLSLAWMGIAPDLYKTIANESSILRFEWFFNLFNDNTLLNIPICFSLFLGWIMLVRKIASAKTIHTFGFFLIAFTYLVLYYKSPFQYARIIGNLDYRILLSVLLGYLLLVLGIAFAIKSIPFKTEGISYAIKKDIKWVICIILLSLVWTGLAPDFYRVITGGRIAVWLEKVYYLIENHLLINILFLLVIIYVWIVLNKKIKSNKKIKFWCFFLILFAFLLLYYKSPFEYVKVMWKFDYRMLLIALLGWSFLLVIFESGKVINDYYRDFKTNNKDLGFSPDFTKNINYSESLKTYARTIVLKLLNTDLSDESFAVGITSEWGAGKTTFLRLLKETIGNKADVLEFNPWMCRTPEQVTSNFFSSLRYQLSERYPFLSRPIQQYAKYLGTVSIYPSNPISINLSNIASEGSLFERKKKLSQEFSQLNKPVVVIIDDIDRLEQDEVFEVLRLIRNTADLSNVIYLVAYDKDYVISALNEKSNIIEASSYMEKIFQLEIRLPLVTRDSIWAMLENELANLQDIKKVFNFNKADKQLILDILNTYRRAKRFAQLFSLNYYHLIKGGTTIELDWREVFWLNLLQMYDKRTFDILCYDKEKLLVIENGLVDYQHIKTDDENEKIDTKTHQILIRLFGELENLKTNVYSIRQIKHYDKYFTLKVQFSKTDFDELMNTEDIDTLIISWRERGVNLAYVIEKLKDHNTVNLDDAHAKKLLYSLLSLSYHKYGASFYKEIRTIPDFFSKKMSKEMLLNWIKDWVIEKLDSNGDRRKVSNIVGALDCTLFSPDKIADLMRVILKDFFDKETKYSALDLLNNDSDLSYFLNNSFREGKRQLAFNTIIDKLSHRQNKPTMEEFQKAYDKFMDDPLYDFGPWHFRRVSQEELNVIKERCIAPTSEKTKNKRRKMFTRWRN